MSQQKGFCFARGEMVDCMPGRIQDCNNKQLHKCPLLEENKENEKAENKHSDKNDKKGTKEKAKQQSFCFIKGELVDCMPGIVQDCNNKQILGRCPLLEEQSDDMANKKSDNKKAKEKPKQQLFCFVKGEMVDCIPGRVQDCNNKQLHKCPLE